MGGPRVGAEKDTALCSFRGNRRQFHGLGPPRKKVTGKGSIYGGAPGGAGSLVSSVLHFAFRSHDGTGPKTALEPVVLNILGYKTYDELALALYQADGKLNRANPHAYDLVPALFELAFQGDRVSQDILAHMGSVMGEMSGRLLNSMGMSHDPTEVVLAGSTIPQGKSPLLVSSFTSACQRHAPLANIKFPDMEPAGGAFLLALENLGSTKVGSGEEPLRHLRSCPRTVTWLTRMKPLRQPQGFRSRSTRDHPGQVPPVEPHPRLPDHSHPGWSQHHAPVEVSLSQLVGHDTVLTAAFLR